MDAIKNNIQVIVISFMVLRSSFLGAMECPMEFNEIKWEEFGAPHGEACDIDSVSIDQEFPEVLALDKQELTEILQRYSNGVAMNKNLDEQLMSRLHEIQTRVRGKCKWYDQYMIKVRESRILGAVEAVNAYKEYRDTHMVAIEDSSVEINEEEKEDPLAKKIRKLDAAIANRLRQITGDATPLPEESGKYLREAAEVESLLSVVRRNAASRS